jgi:hypothetical protein
LLVHPQRTLAWKLNWYRQSELEGALLLGKLVRAADDPFLVGALTRHCADEARHACLWADTIEALALPTVRIFRSYQSFYAPRGGIPGSVGEALALTHAFEKRVWKQFHEEGGQPDVPEAVRATLRTLLEDERLHLDWVRHWLQTTPDGPALVRRFEEIDEQVYAQLAPLEERLWEVPGLGEELQPTRIVHVRRAAGQ